MDWSVENILTFSIFVQFSKATGGTLSEFIASLPAGDDDDGSEAPANAQPPRRRQRLGGLTGPKRKLSEDQPQPRGAVPGRESGGPQDAFIEEAVGEMGLP